VRVIPSQVISDTGERALAKGFKMRYIIINNWCSLSLYKYVPPFLQILTRHAEIDHVTSRFVCCWEIVNYLFP